ncbi:hypothetical protein GCK72_021822 [Caenorhabditis remanei]|uniref:Uncharacterized protein n=1 Tax=Caenorhabditis remanei TaxID=31234 RepID=A0A6A5GKT2_CAERE|nr:hypothetical protein GCK72_021822 [Caenorhabditis remanei]KAF1755253.1 hypothetical protein GCK72_021822 [Caenorhabditis remanei]
MSSSPTMPCPMNMSKDDIELIQLLQYGKVPYTRGLLDMQKERQRDFLTLKRNCKMMFVYYYNERDIDNSEGYQTGFFITCGGILLLHIIVSVGVGVFICCRRKGKSGGGGQRAKGGEAGGKKNKK